MKPQEPPELNIGAVLSNVDRPNNGEAMLPMVRSSSGADSRMVLCVASQEELKFDHTIPIPNLTPKPTPPANKFRNPVGTLPLD